MTIVSAPGKVLLAGGYLVLDQQHTGLVLGLDARMYVAVEDLASSAPRTEPEIHVRSPQFTNAEWLYRLRVREGDGGVEVIQQPSQDTEKSSHNTFVETTLAYALTYLSVEDLSILKSLRVTILADTAYYSRPEGSTDTPHQPDSRFLNFGARLEDVPKTGLGSSAALVTALVGSLVCHYRPIIRESICEDSARNCIHRLAQVSHCAAQGKIGSGFDVAAAVYGSCVYRRFAPSILQQLGGLGGEGFSTRLSSLVDHELANTKWDSEILPLEDGIPRGLRLAMCDVERGSNTRSMVQKIMAWKRENQEQSSLLWEKLQQGTDNLNAALRTAPPASSSSDARYESLRLAMQSVRELVQQLSASADVPVEPNSQTRLLDACSHLPGVIGGLVPGAGGYDALAFIVEDREGVMSSLEPTLRLCSSASPEGRENLSPGTVRVLEVGQESAGLRMEPMESLRPWLGE